jgi:hypothetical protein
LLLVIIFISLNKKLKECYKWFILHTAILSLAFILIGEIINMLAQAYVDLYKLHYFSAFVGNLSVNSMLLLSINRFIFLYCKTCHYRLYTIKKYIWIMILLYDLAIAVILLTVKSLFVQHTVEYILISILLILYIAFPVLILIKIRKMAKLLPKNNFHSTTLLTSTKRL